MQNSNTLDGLRSGDSHGSSRIEASMTLHAKLLLYNPKDILRKTKFWSGVMIIIMMAQFIC